MKLPLVLPHPSQVDIVVKPNHLTDGLVDCLLYCFDAPCLQPREVTLVTVDEDYQRRSVGRLGLVTVTSKDPDHPLCCA